MISIKLENFKTQVGQFGKGKDDNAQALLQALGCKLILADDIINAEIKNALKKISNLYYLDSEEYKILNKDCETYNLQVTSIKKDESKNKENNYVVTVEAHRTGSVCGRFLLSLHTSNPNSSYQKFCFSCFWNNLTFFPSPFTQKEIVILTAFPALKRLYYYTSAQCALDDFKNKHIKVSRLRKVNDAYECMPIMHNVDGSIMKPNEVRDFRDKVVQKPKGFISFSEDWDIEPMWGLYANSYEGAVLEFDVDPSRVRKVSYQEKRFDCQCGRFAFDLPEFFYRKSQNWSFEHEWRWIQELVVKDCFFDGNYHFIPIDIYNETNNPIKLKRIICGPLMPPEDIDRLWHMHIKLSKDASKIGKQLNVRIIETEFNLDAYGLREGLIIV